MVFAYLAGAIILAVGVWLFGSIIARVAGVVLAMFGLLGMLTSGAIGNVGAAAAAFVIFLLGLTLWLAGHWMFAYKHHVWRSALARRLFSSTALRRVDPTRGWAFPVRHVD